ncbi:exopolysaccharide biosynthesis protein [Cereibacter sp. SYSU M97828]|nr:exopolysaccharide biosynthesis protein [Cereibacter flavus]
MNEFGKAGLTSVLDQLDELTDEDQVSIGQIVDKLGASSFASLMLIFALIAVSPASAIPGVTASVGLIVAILVVQMMAGKKSAWLPAFLLRRQLSAQKLKTGLAWLRKPVGWIERILRQRLTAVLHRPVLLLPLTLVLCLALFMPVMELVPTSGSVASTVIALFAAGLLVRDGVLVILSMTLMLAVPAVIWQFGFAG